MSANYQHTPALSREVIALLNIREGKTYVDCTLGGGGHTEKLKTQNLKCKIIGIDQDQDAIEAAKKRLLEYRDIKFIRDNFKNLKEIVKDSVDGILFDLGVSSYQIDEASRGFSIQKDGPLDMRMDLSKKLTAEYIINNYDEEELVEIFENFGEERFSKRVARHIVEKRPVKTTQDLRKIIEKAIPTWKKRESVTRIFQALRIEVNNELESLKIALQDAIELLSPGGRIVVISYHSLEDRIVKQTLRQAKVDGKLNLLTKKPVRPSENEAASNPRAKSAKLRAGEKLR
jgi:16S rRNA (cytosine1402-N4)-methyltransferase